MNNLVIGTIQQLTDVEIKGILIPNIGAGVTTIFVDKEKLSAQRKELINEFVKDLELLPKLVEHEELYRANCRIMAKCIDLLLAKWRCNEEKSKNSHH